MAQVRHKGCARTAEPEDLAVCSNLLQQLRFGATAIQMKHRVAESLARNVLVVNIPGACVAEDGVLGDVQRRRSRHYDGLISSDVSRPDFKMIRLYQATAVSKLPASRQPKNTS